MNRERLNWWVTLLANIGVLGGLVFVGLEIRQNTRQLRADASHSITESVNQINASLYSDPTLTDIVLRGEADLGTLTPIERSRFALYHFSRLNVADYILDLRDEGVSDLNFSFVAFVVQEYHTKPGLQEFIRSVEATWAGSDELLTMLLGG